MKKLNAFSLLFIICMVLIPALFAATPGQENQLKLVPEPKEVRILQEVSM